METYQIIGILYAIVGAITFAWTGINYFTIKQNGLQPASISHILITLVRIMMGVLFIYSGFVKANDYIGFNYKLEEYFEKFTEDIPALEWLFLGLLKPTAIYQAWFISVLEIALGVAIIVGYKMRATMWFTLVLMLFFTFLTGYSWYFNKVTDCGCFGDALKLKTIESFYKDIILTVMTLPVLWVSRHLKPFVSPKFAGSTTILTFIVMGIFAYVCHEYLPLIDYRAYKVGVNLQACSTTPEAPGLPPKCKDYEEVYRINLAGVDSIPTQTVKTANGDSAVAFNVVKRPGVDANPIDEFKGNVLMIVMYDMDNAPAEEIQKTVDLTNQLKGSDIQVLALTGTGKSVLEENYLPKYKFPYQLSLRDVTMLKTIIRSNPGYVLLKDGVVLKKWHYHTAPTEGQLKDWVRNK